MRTQYHKAAIICSHGQGMNGQLVGRFVGRRIYVFVAGRTQGKLDVVIASIPSGAGKAATIVANAGEFQDRVLIVGTGLIVTFS
jgi:hypothetical protein